VNRELRRGGQPQRRVGERCPHGGTGHDAANQVLEWRYDAAGNLLSDGTRTLDYDALGRLSSVAAPGTTSVAAPGTTTTYRYSGDGVLASQTTTGTTTRSTQDLQAPLSQILEVNRGGTTTTYRYGQARLSEVQGGSRTWYRTDALGSVRQTLTDTGTASAAIHYDPWGTPTEGTLPSFGFTGELQDALGGLVHLRPRWYLPAQGAFASRDPCAGFPAQPYSLHPYQYGYSNPARYTDPSGQNPLMCAVPALADGPFPIGDGVAVACLLGELVVGHCNFGECR
jgi:RHS repeat-associated protein